MAGQHKVVNRKKNFKSSETLYNEDVNTNYGVMSKGPKLHTCTVYTHVPRVFHGHDGSDKERLVSYL